MVYEQTGDSPNYPILYAIGLLGVININIYIDRMVLSVLMSCIKGY